MEAATSVVKGKFYQVVRVIDGDTIEVKIGAKKEKVRLIGIDTPETVHPTKSVECFGKEASDKAKKLMTGKKVKLEVDSTNSNRDKYQRLLRYVYLQNGTFVNAYMVQKGYANAYIAFPFKYMEEFKKYQKDAMNKSLGLWNPNICPVKEEKVNIEIQSGQFITEDGKCLIKGNISAKGEKIYHVPGGDFYTKTVIDESKSEKWFCSEEDAQTAGWRKSQK